jgi:glycogen debranching enzyme
MPSGRIRIGNEYYLLASALAPRGRRLLLNAADTFAIFDEGGDIPLASQDTVGLFSHGTRFLSRLELLVNGTHPFLLSAGTVEDGSELVIHLTNSDERRGGEVILQRDSVALQRRMTLVDGALSETLLLYNYSTETVFLHLELLYAVDFADIFELRGVERSQRGSLPPPEVEGAGARFAYVGLDAVRRLAELRFAPSNWRVTPSSAEIEVSLEPGEQRQLRLQIHCRIGDTWIAPADYDSVLSQLRATRRACAESFPQVSSNNQAFTEWMQSSVRDLTMLSSMRDTGPYVYAGIPWFATVFGRDGLVTAIETLAFAPTVAAGVLRALAALQGRQHDPLRDEDPGKIVHELREGEMAATGEVPFGRYYGSVDSTPLFLAVLAAYAQRSGDLDLARELWPAARAAVDWIERNIDGRGYLAYERRTPRGLINQGWKDSHDSISHADGSLAAPPIALCEVQAYVYAALQGLASLARRLGDVDEAQSWSAQAFDLRERFEKDFWMPEEQCYALALDRAGRPCHVVTSNAGHCLSAGIAVPSHAHAVVARLMREDCFCGWGVRTLSSKERRYNPMSYHNGSVWPHDNALIALGFARYGRTGEAAHLLSALFEASLRQEERRLPELFCGFPRSRSEPPVAYPVACRPQAWAAGSAFLLLQAALGLEIDGWKHRVTLSSATLPQWLDYIDIRGLPVNGATVDIRVHRGSWGTSVEILDKKGDVDIVVRK